MLLLELLAAVLVVLLAVGTGTVVHELLHAAVLRLAGVDCDVRWLQGGRTGRLGAGLFGTWASVRMTSIPSALEPWQLRIAALSPLLLAAPLVAIGAGVVPDPFALDNLYLELAVVGWLACALPSPQDFSVVWHAPQLLARATAEKADGSTDASHDATAAVPASRAD